MINEYDTVRIKGTNIKGTVIDIHTVNGKTMCYIDSDQTPDGKCLNYNADWGLFYCELNDLEALE